MADPDTTLLLEADVRARLAASIGEATQRRWCADHGIDQAALSRALRGGTLTDPILAALGLRRASTRYEPSPDSGLPDPRSGLGS